jgi:prephenate dehydratase
MGSGRRRVGYLGPEGTFTEEALLASAANGSVEPVAFASIFETVTALLGGLVDFTIAPIENSLEGSIGATLDLLTQKAGRIEIVCAGSWRTRA